MSISQEMFEFSQCHSVAEANDKYCHVVGRGLEPGLLDVEDEIDHVNDLLAECQDKYRKALNDCYDCGMPVERNAEVLELSQQINKHTTRVKELSLEADRRYQPVEDTDTGEAEHLLLYVLRNTLRGIRNGRKSPVLNDWLCKVFIATEDSFLDGMTPFKDYLSICCGAATCLAESTNMPTWKSEAERLVKALNSNKANRVPRMVELPLDTQISARVAFNEDELIDMISFKDTIRGLSKRHGLPIWEVVELFADYDE